ncbi:Dolichyl-diphosphooligosaccharide--protein glycosyltransferase subunit 2 [Balamuthia mandrillaris]
MLIGLLFLGANLRNFPSGVSSVYALGFQGCLAALVGLFALYWLYLNMLQTLGYLALLAVPTIFFGNRALAALAAHDKQE